MKAFGHLQQPQETPCTKWLGLFFWASICFSVAVLGSLATSSSLDTWYDGLVKPDWNPPAWVFGPVWTVLYAMMGVSAWLVWQRRHQEDTDYPLGWFAVQLMLNLLWSLFFFGLRSPLVALMDIVMLWAAIAITMNQFWRVHRGASLLMFPYLLWVSFATALNAAILYLN